MFKEAKTKRRETEKKSGRNDVRVYVGVTMREADDKGRV